MADQIVALVRQSRRDATVLKDISDRLAILISETNNQPTATTNVASFNQQGGITAGQVNISGTNVVQVNYKQSTLNVLRPDGSYESTAIMTLSGLVPDFSIVVSNPIVLDWGISPAEAGIMAMSEGKNAKGDTVRKILNAAGDYRITVHTRSPVSSDIDINFGCAGVSCVSDK